MATPKKSDAELEGMSLEELRQLAVEEAEEIEIEAAKAVAEQEAADAIAAEKAAAVATETSEEKATREAAEVEAAKVAEKEAAEKEAAEKTEQERDVQGRFKKVEPPVPPEDEPDEYIFRREIDLGDGTGVQVFEGRGETELDAIKELNDKLVVSEENGNKIRDWVQSHNYNEFTQENLEKAFEDLSGSGLLTLKTDGASAPTKTEVKTEVKAARIETPVTEVVTEVPQVQSPKKASTVSSKGSPAPVIKTEPTEDEAYTMPLEQLKALAEKQLREANRA